MVHSNGINVSVIRFGCTREYKEHPGKNHEAYIEVTTGERYRIVTRLDKKFDFKKYSHVEVEYSIDGGEKIHTHISRKSVEKKTTDRSGYYEDKLDHVNSYVDGTWQKCGLSFTGLANGKGPPRY